MKETLFIRVRGVHTHLAFLLFALLTVDITSTAFAQNGDVTVNLIAQLVVTDDKGVEKLDKAEKAKPGNILQYTAVYQNTGKDAVANLQATLPIPKGTVFIPDTTSPEGALASVDGTKFEAIPLKWIVKQADGTEKEVAVPFSEYRALRWTVGKLGADEKTSVSARVKVVSSEK